MWNPLRTLRKRDSRRLLELEDAVSDLSDQLGQLRITLNKLDSRSRARGSRARDGVDDAVPSAGSDNGSGDPASPGAQLVPDSTQPTEAAVKKAQMRALHRQRLFGGR